jgi:transcriptional regulator with XRE-family HTH domain
MQVLVPQVRRLRLMRALSQEELAARAGVSRNTVVRAEQGEDIRPSSVRKLARALGVSPATLQKPDDT